MTRGTKQQRQWHFEEKENIVRPGAKWWKMQLHCPTLMMSPQLATKNGRIFSSSSARHIRQSRYSTSDFYL